MNENTLNKNIAELRKAAGLTQEQLATRLGISYQAVSKWENAQSCPDVMLLPRLAEIFGVSIDALFGLEKAKTTLVPVEEPTQSELPWPDDEGIYVVIYEGHRLVTGDPTALSSRVKDIPLSLRGTPKNVSSVLSVRVDGSVAGDLSAGGSVTCDNVGGSAIAGGNITCDNIQGNAEAGGGISCDDIRGNASAGLGITADEIYGDVHAGGRVTCDTIMGSAYYSGGVYCDEGYVVDDDLHGIHGSFTLDMDDMSPEQKAKYENIKKNAENIADSALGAADSAINAVEKALKGIFRK